jgi:hypothetical protein
MKTNMNLLRASRVIMLVGTALLFHSPLSATIVHLCSGGTYTQTEIYYAPFPEPAGSWHSTTTVMGPCSGEWSYTEMLTVAGATNSIFALAEADSGYTLPKSDPAFVNLSAALAKAAPSAQRRVSTRLITETEARATLSQSRLNRPLVLRFPVSGVSDPRCSMPYLWNGFACVDSSLAPVSLPIPYNPLSVQ